MSVRTPAFFCATAVLLLALVAACGGNAEPAAKENAEPEATASEAEKTGPLNITPPAKKFCDKIDLAAVGELFGGEEPVILRAVEAGEMVSDFGEEKPSKSTLCDIRIRAENQISLYVEVADPQLGAKLKKNFAKGTKQIAKQYEGAGATCKEVVIDGFGDPTAGVQCAPGNANAPAPQAVIAFSGVFGEAWMGCNFNEYTETGSDSASSQRQLDEVATKMKTFCLDTAAAIAE